MKRLFRFVLAVTLITALLMIFTSPALAADPYFAEDFESTGLGLYPDSFDGSSSIAPYAAGVVNFSSSNWFAITSIGWGTSINSADFVLNPAETNVILEFDIIAPLTEDLTLIHFGVPGNSMTAAISTDGAMWDYNVPMPYAPPGTFLPDTVHHVMIDLDLVNDNIDVYVDSTQYAFDIPAHTSVPTSSVRFSVYDMSPEGEPTPVLANFDNVVVTGAVGPEIVNPRTGDKGSFGYVVILAAVLAFGFVGFVIRRKTVVN